MLTDERVTMQDIADRANVSISTVSRVLRGSAAVTEAKRRAVLAAVAELDYRPNVLAQGLASGETKTIGVLTQFISAPLYDTILHGILEGLRGTGYSPLFADGYWQPNREQRSLQIFLDRRVDGLIVLGGASPERLLRELAAQVPLIVVGRSIDGLEHHCLPFGNVQGAHRATSYLIERGHTQIAHITGILDHEDARQRCDGYTRALTDAGLGVNQELIVEGNFVEQSGVLAVEMLLGRGRVFSAIFAANDQMAYGARLALFRRGIRVPDDVSLVGFDDQPPSAYTIPPLTTVRQPAVEMGQAAAQAILRLIQGEEVEMPEFPAELVLRESVAWHG